MLTPEPSRLTRPIRSLTSRLESDLSALAVWMMPHAGLALRPHNGEADLRVTLAGVLKKMGGTDEAPREWQVVAKIEAMYPSYDEPIRMPRESYRIMDMRHG